MKREPFKPMLPDDLNAAIGAFITTWSNVSGLFAVLISNLAAGRTIGPGDDMLFAFAHIGMDVRVQIGLLKTMGAARLGKKNEAALCKLCEKLEKSKAMRDRLAHSPWEVGGEKPIAHIIKTVGTVKAERQTFTADSVKAETQKLIELVGDLVELVQKHGFLADYVLSSAV